jgi:hypothetical protein
MKQEKNEAKSMHIIYFDFKEIVHREFVLTVLHTTVTFYGKCMKMCENFTPNFRQQKNWLLHHYNAPSHTSIFTREYLTKNNMTSFPHPPYFSMFPRMEIKLKGCHFHTTEVMETESQSVLNTLTEHDFQDSF